ncbi:phthiocerol/phthiodiolone dimycocerosyl transferase family protein [Couchioplanes caeruleus]|uniref:Phthiocerol/phthiodiolone dimycocerosyl transferase n=1 Tax=Couchioplanes caeruleus TaxID=56438 RepID=A0A3N1GEG2_9ACTN|nr:condensation domain-containing protein [Couchioplanes caeruleus]ROP28548.1 condensation domain-containing protein [Couchioplanes caeruleus]
MSTSAGEHTDPDVRRPLSPLERWYWIADQISPLHVIARVRLHGHFAPELARRSLDGLQARHPLLRVAIATDAGRPAAFVPCAGTIPLREVTTTDADAETRWQQEINDRELVDRLDWRTGPLLRAVVVTRGDEVHDLVLTLAHCIADGTTALSLLQQWIRIADGYRSGAGAPARARSLPAPEDLFPRRHRGTSGALAVVRAQLRDQIARVRWRPRRIAASAAVPFDRRRTGFIHRSLSAAQVDALADVCRREGATVHGALAAAMAAAVAEDAGSGADGHVVVGSPVDFRGELDPPVSPDEVGAYVATIPSYVPHRPGAPLWPAARAVSDDLARRRRRGEHLSMIGLLRWLGPPDLAASTPFVRQVERQGPGNLCLSNLGRHQFPDELGPWRLSGAQFVAGISVSGYFVATVNTTHDHLFWNFTYVDGIVPRARAERLADACVTTLLSAVAADPHRGRTHVV